MAHPKDTRIKARNMYVNTLCQIPTISVALDVPEGTLRKWKSDAKQSGDCWDVARHAATMKGEGQEAVVGGVLENVIVMVQVTLDQIQEDPNIPPAEKVKLMASLSDSFHKIVLAAGRLAPKLNEMAIAMDVVKRLADFIRSEFPQHSTAFQEVLEPFGIEISKAYN